MGSGSALVSHIAMIGILRRFASFTAICSIVGSTMNTRPGGRLSLRRPENDRLSRAYCFWSIIRSFFVIASSSASESSDWKRASSSLK